jgi:cytochrome c550
MSQENKPIAPATPTTETGRSLNSYIVLGAAFVVVLVVAIVAMLIITGGDVAETKAPASLSADATAGKALFLQSNCGSCHPSEGRAGGIGPRLSTTNISDDSIRNTIRKGKGGMPANPQLSQDQLDKIVAYIRALKPS